MVQKEREVHSMNTYTIYFGTTPIVTISGTEYAYAKAKELAELLGEECSLVWDDTGEEVTWYNSEEN
jgi:hypothetical protein